MTTYAISTTIPFVSSEVSTRRYASKKINDCVRNWTYVPSKLEKEWFNGVANILRVDDNYINAPEEDTKLREIIDKHKKIGTPFDYVHVWERSGQQSESKILHIDAYSVLRITFSKSSANDTRSLHEELWTTMRNECGHNDFVVMYLNMRNRNEQYALIDFLFLNGRVNSLVNELYFNDRREWGLNENDAFAVIKTESSRGLMDSYNLFRVLRERGVRAHAWI
eukprot:gene1048-1587_t